MGRKKYETKCFLTHEQFETVFAASHCISLAQLARIAKIKNSRKRTKNGGEEEEAGEEAEEEATHYILLKDFSSDIEKCSVTFWGRKCCARKSEEEGGKGERERGKRVR